MSDRICLRLGRGDMNTFSTIDKPGQRPVVRFLTPLQKYEI